MATSVARPLIDMSGRGGDAATPPRPTRRPCRVATASTGGVARGACTPATPSVVASCSTCWWPSQRALLHRRSGRKALWTDPVFGHRLQGPKWCPPLTVETSAMATIRVSPHPQGRPGRPEPRWIPHRRGRPRMGPRPRRKLGGTPVRLRTASARGSRQMRTARRTAINPVTTSRHPATQR